MQSKNVTVLFRQVYSAKVSHHKLNVKPQSQTNASVVWVCPSLYCGNNRTQYYGFSKHKIRESSSFPPKLRCEYSIPLGVKSVKERQFTVLY